MSTYSDVIYSEKEAINAVWVLTSTAMIFFMQTGFALLECGSVRQKNSSSILIKNLFDACIGSIGFWLVGYAFAFGDVKQFIGGSPDYFASSGFEKLPEDNYLLWIFHFSFASTSASIVSGSLAERCQLNSYIIYSFLQTSFIYPVVVAWTWGGGWLTQMGFHDFAGVSTIHMVGGCAGLVGASILGERYGKDKDRKARLLHNNPES
jgi:Amt family ammonium transporter